MYKITKVLKKLTTNSQKYYEVLSIRGGGLKNCHGEYFKGNIGFCSHI